MKVKTPCDKPHLSHSDKPSPAAAGSSNSPPGAASKVPPELQPRVFNHPAEMEAARLWELLIPGRLSAMLGEEVSSAGVVIAFNRYLEQCMPGSDPVLRILLEQLYIGHHRLARLQVQADRQTSPEAVKAYNAAAARLLGEIRRLALSIKAYSLPPSQKTFSVVHQQNLVSNGEQHVAYLNAGKGKASFFVRDKLKDSDPTVEGDMHGFRERIVKEPAASGRRAAERPIAAAMEG